jgi:hypothetical protein
VNKIGPSLVGVVGPQELVRTGTTARRCWRADGTAPRSPLGTARVWMPFHVATRRRAISGGANRTMDGRLSVRSAVNSLMIGSPDLDDPVSLLERRSSHCINGTSRTQMHIASSRREGQLSSNLRASSEPISLRENPEQADKAMKLQCRNVPTGALARLALKRGRLFAGSAKHFGFRTNVISSTGRSLSAKIEDSKSSSRGGRPCFDRRASPSESCYRFAYAASINSCRGFYNFLAPKRSLANALCALT